MDGIHIETTSVRMSTRQDLAHARKYAEWGEFVVEHGHLELLHAIAELFHELVGFVQFKYHIVVTSLNYLKTHQRFIKNIISLSCLVINNVELEKLTRTLSRKACCSATNSLICLFTSLTTHPVDSLVAVHLDKHSRSYASISLINVLDALWMLSIAVSRAMSTCWRIESQCSRILQSDTSNALTRSADESPICAKSDLNFAIELDGI